MHVTNFPTTFLLLTPDVSIQEELETMANEQVYKEQKSYSGQGRRVSCPPGGAGALVVKNSPANAGDTRDSGLIPRLATHSSILASIEGPKGYSQ